jgi:YggT family protein
LSPSNPLIAYWWFHLPNLVLAALMYTVLGRFVLSFVFPPESQNYIFRFFVRVTDPVVSAVRFVTPLAVPHMVVLLFSAVWLLAARAALYVLLASAGLAPTPGVTPQ